MPLGILIQVQVKDEVTLTGTVEEYFNLTELTDIIGIVHGESEQELVPSLIRHLKLVRHMRDAY